jgi:hypothetical protein
VATIAKASATDQNDSQTTTIKEVTRVTEDEKIIEISKILTAWNPLGERAAAMKDLDNYQTEAVDIMSVIDLYGYPPKKAVSEIIREAFLIDLEKTELDHYSSKIKAVLEK